MKAQCSQTDEQMVIVLAPFPTRWAGQSRLVRFTQS